MTYTETALPGVFVIDAPQHEDERGGFQRLHCETSMRERGLNFTAVQTNLSTNRRRATLRGLHFQHPPHAEAKLVQVLRGRIFDVAVDLRSGPTFAQWVGIELSADKPQTLYLPEGIAHGFITMTDESDVLYHMGRTHVPCKAAGLRWDDPDIGINWPCEPRIMSEADRNWPMLSELRSELLPEAK